MKINKGDTIKIIDSREGVVEVVQECIDGGLRIWFEGDHPMRYYRTGVSELGAEPGKSADPPFTRSIEIIERAPQWQSGDVVVLRSSGEAVQRNMSGVWFNSDDIRCSTDGFVESHIVKYIIVIKMGKLV